MRKIKNYLLMGMLLFGITFVVISCKDDFENQDTISKKSPFSMRTIYGEELNQKQKIVKQINTFNKKSLNKSGVYNEQYDFTIETAFAKYIESEDRSFHTYTFLVHREEDNGLLENLVFTSQLDGTYETELIAYTFLDSGEVEVKHASLSINSEDYLNKSFSFSWSCTTTYICTEWRTFCYDCSEPDSESWVECVSSSSNTNCEMNYTYISASPSSGGGGGSSATDSGGGFGDGIWTGGGGASTSNPNIATSAFTLQEIEKLTIQTNHSKIKAKIEFMKTRLTVETHELGNEYRKIISPIGSLQIIDYDEIECNVINNNWIEFPPVQSNSKVRLHMHQNYDSNGNRTSTIFGQKDVIESARFYTDLKNLLPDLKDNGNLSNIVVTRHGLYALRVSNISKAQNFINTLLNPHPEHPNVTNEHYYNYTYPRRLVKFLLESCPPCSEQEIGELSEQFFIDYLIDEMKNNTGLDLYFSSETDENGNYIWIKK